MLVLFLFALSSSLSSAAPSQAHSSLAPICPKPGMFLKELEGVLKQVVDSDSVVKKLSKLNPDEFKTLVQASLEQIEGCGLKNELETATLLISEDPELASALVYLLAPIENKFPNFGACSSMSNESAPLVRRADRADVEEGVEMVEPVPDDEISSNGTPPDEADVDECCICLESLEDSSRETYKCKGCTRLLHARYIHSFH